MLTSIFFRNAPIIIAGLLGACCMFAWSGCDHKIADRGRSNDGPLRVVATFSILGDWVKQVGGDRIELVTLVNAGGDPHTYEPTPQDAVVLNRAALLFENGLEFETWLDKLYKSSGTAAKRVVATSQIGPEKLLAFHHAHQAGDHCEHCAHGHQHGDTDPHIWQSPLMAKSVVRAIADALSAHDPEHKLEYQDRAANYMLKLDQLDQEIRESVKELPAEGRILITTHDTFAYFAAEYGFKVSSVLGSATSDVADPSASGIGDVVNSIKAMPVKAVFTENTVNPKLTERVAREANVKLVRSLYTDALGGEESLAADYLGMMRYNVRVIVESLQ
ncbi:MAG TPA: metal ABC transporter substrate-binding protein [Pirellulaceae bacterium]|nr:metal ABC transporter substrate-binding protein [Pirellulaceae bacterium]HMO93342.1 metal ABC transporter substrate-binding protein [Pirellulaceae bacterium]HMP70113.1 metal ABC transporter substrate-binding protein [Pirellulaceae bacterium]